MTRQAAKRAQLSHIPPVLHVTERELKRVHNRCQEFHRQYQYQKYEYNSQKHVVLLGQGDNEEGKEEVYHEPRGNEIYTICHKFFLDTVYSPIYVGIMELR